MLNAIILTLPFSCPPRRDLPRSGEESEPIIPRGRISNYDTFPKLLRKGVASGRIAKIVVVVVVSLLSFQFLTIWGRSLQLDMWSREVKEHQERLEEWKQEMQAHGQEREEWRREREDQRAEFARERLVFERERQEWQRERMAHKPFWGELEHVSPYCLAYNTMEYKARLWNVPLGGDWLEACQGTSQEIHGRTIEKPERCEDRVSFRVSELDIVSLLSLTVLLILGTERRILGALAC